VLMVAHGFGLSLESVKFIIFIVNVRDISHKQCIPALIRILNWFSPSTMNKNVDLDGQRASHVQVITKCKPGAPALRTSTVFYHVTIVGSIAKFSFLLIIVRYTVLYSVSF
jgi:hypothetical protein